MVDVKSLRPGNMYAVIIGIGEYADERLNLRYTDDDARDLYELLTDPNYGGVPKDHIRLLVDEDAEYYKIKSAIGNWLSNRPKKRILCLFIIPDMVRQKGTRLIG